MKLLRIVVLGVSVIFASSVYAGSYSPEPMEIILPANDGDTGSVQGAMGQVRFTDNDVERIGCRVRGVTGLPAQVSCLARDEFGTNAGCASSDPSLVAAAQAISTYSWIYFTWTQDSSRAWFQQICDTLYVSTRSFHIPDTANQKGK